MAVARAARENVVGTYGARSPDELLRVLASPPAALCGLVELRLDYLDRPGEALPALLEACPRPAVATCRRRRDGGAFDGDERERLALLARAAELGAAWIDVESDVPDDDRPPLRSAQLLRSVHLDRLPGDLGPLVATLLASPAAAGKLVAWSGDEHDALRLMRAIHASDGRLCGHVVEQPFTRFASVLLGAPFAYAALRPGGRIDARLPGVHEFRGAAGDRAFVLIGADVERSVGPRMLNATFEAAGDDIVALRWSCADPEPALQALVEFGWAGAAVTTPYKTRVLGPLVRDGAELGPTALAVGAVNTVVAVPDGLAAHNTDLGGILDSVSPHLPDGRLDGRAGLVLGAGGAARAAVRAVLALGGRAIVYARRPGAAETLRDLADAGQPPVEIATTAEDAAAPAPALVLDATPAGPPGGVPFFDPALLPGPSVVLDMLVAAEPTALLAAAERAGHTAIPGLRMLAHQAARQVELLTGRTADAAAMLETGTRALHARRIVLLGLRCSGKSAAGAALAALTGRPFVDTDREVERRAGRTPDDLLGAGEEKRFRDCERAALEDARSVPGAVVATGGGAALSPAALGALCRDAHVVLLDAADDVLLARLAREPRAALSDLAPGEELARQRSERMATYRRLASEVVDTGGRDPDGVAEQIIARLPL